MESTATLVNVPLGIFDLICNFLSMFDIAKLEQTSKIVKERIEQSLIWKKEAERFQRRFGFKLTEKLIEELKSKNLCYTKSSKFYKIIIGVSGHVKKAMKHLEVKEKKLSDEVKQEVDTYIFNLQHHHQPNEEPVHQWIQKVLKLYLEIELIKGKKVQILTLQDTFKVQNEEVINVNESIDMEMINNSKIIDILVKPDCHCHCVTKDIAKFGSWTEATIQPTEDEIMLLAKAKATSIMTKIQARFIEVELDI